MIGPVVEFVAVKLGIFPVPLASKPISVLSINASKTDAPGPVAQIGTKFAE